MTRRVPSSAAVPDNDGRGSAPLHIVTHCEWQVSCTRFEADGQLEQHKGFDRQLVLLAGDAFELNLASEADGVRFTHTVDTPLAPFAFRGEWTVDCRLRGGSAEALDVLTRRGRSGAHIDTLVPTHARPLSKLGGESLIAFVATGSATAWGRWGEAQLGPGDAVVIDEPGREEIALAASGTGARVLVVRIQSLP